MTYVFTGDGLDDILWRCAKQLRDDRKLVDMVLPREEWLPLEHLGEDTSCTPDIDRDIVFLPCEHDLGGTVVPCRDISCHLRILDTCKTEIADLEIAVLIYENIGWFKISVNYTGRVYVFETTL